MKNRSVAIDALRGLAALTIIFYHAREILWIGVTQTWRVHHLEWNLNALLGYATWPFYFGQISVPLFFVISGYCIHRPHVMRLATDADYKLQLVPYTIRRMWRIYPVLLSSLSVVLPAFNSDT